MTRNKIKIRDGAYSRSSINKFKDFDRLSREYRRRQIRLRSKRIAYLVAIVIIAIIAIIYGLKI